MFSGKLKKGSLGEKGEKIARSYFRKKGYRIKELNYSTLHGEIDIIAENREYIVFVEVKTRTVNENSPHTIRPAAAVNRDKKEHLRYAAQKYLKKYDSDKRKRFDVIEITAHKCFWGHKYKINHIESAF